MIRLSESDWMLTLYAPLKEVPPCAIVPKVPADVFEPKALSFFTMKMPRASVVVPEYVLLWLITIVGCGGWGREAPLENGVTDTVAPCVLPRTRFPLAVPPLLITPF